MPVWAGLLIAFVATSIMNFGLAVQKRGAANLPKIGKDQGVAKAFFTNWVWLSGTAGLMAGWGLYAYSSKIAPISLVQPTLGMGLAVLALFSVFYLKEKIKPVEWVALAGMIAGMVLLGLSSVEEAPKAVPKWAPFLAVTAAALLLSGLAYVLGKRGKLAAVRTEALLGIVAGLFVGLGAIYMRAMFLFVDAGEKFYGYGICLPVFVVSFILGIGIVQSGFQHGTALVVVGLEAVLNKVVAIIGGMVALSETLPQDSSLAITRVVAFVLILSGSFVLARFGKEKKAKPSRG